MTYRLLRPSRHLRELGAVAADIGHLMGDDQVVPGIDRSLHVVADDAGALAAGRHRPRIRVGQRNLRLGGGLNHCLHRLELLHLRPQRRNLLPQPRRLRLRHLALLPVGGIHGRQVARDAGLDLLDPALQLGRGVVPVAVVHRLELAAVDRDHGLGEQLQPPAQQHELPAGRLDCRSVVAAEVGDGLEVRHQPAGQPHQLQVALGLPLQPPARRDPVQIAVEVDLEQRRRMVRRPAGRLRHHAGKAQTRQIQLLDEGLDGADRIVLADIVVQAVRQQRGLTTVLPLDETLHACPRLSRPEQRIRSQRFHTAWT
ncbi:Uncharacterised protein [Mycobacteroides abscessus subsp. massiliense]|nr:Uncharacterised protein [Mycobacteroides abscessus subsp. massiliense]